MQKLSVTLIFVCLISYVAAIVYLLFIFGFSPSHDIAQLGQTGDYFGGLLNPIIGICSAVLLALTLKINLDLRKDAQQFYKADRFSHRFFVQIELLSKTSERLLTNEKYVKRLKTFMDGQNRGLSIEKPGNEPTVPKIFLNSALANGRIAVALVKTLLNDLQKEQNLSDEEKMSFVWALKGAIGDEVLIPLAIDYYVHPEKMGEIYEKFAIFELANLRLNGDESKKYGADQVVAHLTPKMRGQRDKENLKNAP
jgi:hypothetical protein